MASPQQNRTILHVIDTTGPGGAETVFLTLAMACNENGYHSHALIRGPGWVEERLKAMNIEYQVLDCKGSFNFRYLMQLLKTVKQLKPLAIQSHLLGSNVYASLVGILSRTPVIATFHGYVDISPKERLRWVKLLLIGLGAKRIVAVTPDLKNGIAVSGNWLLRRKAKVIPNGISTEQFDGIAQKRLESRSASPLVFGCLGNVRRAKNYQLAVDFIVHLNNKGVSACLRIAGDDTNTMARKLKEYCREKGVASNVTFCGFIDDVPGFFDSIDIFLMTSSSEGQPLALTQALAAGIPVLTTPSGVEEIIPGELIFVSKDHSADSLFESLNRILVEEVDSPELYLKRRSYIQQHFSAPAMVEAYLRDYEK